MLTCGLILLLQENERAKQFVERISKNMTASEIEEAKKLALMCIDTEYEVCQ